jgi:hypothetical protein
MVVLADPGVPKASETYQELLGSSSPHASQQLHGMVQWVLLHSARTAGNTALCCSALCAACNAAGLACCLQHGINCRWLAGCCCLCCSAVCCCLLRIQNLLDEVIEAVISATNKNAQVLWLTGSGAQSCPAKASVRSCWLSGVCQ